MAGSDRLDGKVAVVTGASAGIGEATALALAEAGASVVLTARREDRLEDLAKRIRDAGGTALVHAADVASLEDVQSLTDAALSEFGRVDILVNNAGLMPLSPLAEVRIEDWTRMVDVNVKGVLHCIATMLPGMIERGSGHQCGIAGRLPAVPGRVRLLGDEIRRQVAVLGDAPRARRRARNQGDGRPTRLRLDGADGHGARPGAQGTLGRGVEGSAHAAARRRRAIRSP